MENGKTIRDRDGLGLKKLMVTNILGNGRMIKKLVIKLKDSVIKIQVNSKTAQGN